MKSKCKHIEKIQNSFKWMITDDKRSRLMPHLGINDHENIRVNFCPVCGVNCRDVQIKIKK